MTKQIYHVAVYLADRMYGGPEEGGWWYDAGFPSEEHVQFTRLFNQKVESEDEWDAPPAAIEYADRLRRHLVRKLNEGRRSIGSVLSEGEYRVRIERDYPKAFPAERPYYE